MPLYCLLLGQSHCTLCRSNRSSIRRCCSLLKRASSVGQARRSPCSASSRLSSTEDSRHRFLSVFGLVRGLLHRTQVLVGIGGSDVDLTRLDQASIANLGIGRKSQKPAPEGSWTRPMCAGI